jgi:hypothetical protein
MDPNALGLDFDGGVENIPANMAALKQLAQVLTREL